MRLVIPFFAVVMVRPGAEVELTVEGEAGPRAVRLARAPIDEHVARREAPLPTEAEVGESLLTASWWCFEEERELVVEGVVRRGGMAVTRVDGPPPLAECVRDAIEAAPGPIDRHGRFAWTVRRGEQGTAEMRTTVLPPAAGPWRDAR